MPNYTFVTLDARGPEPKLRTRLQVLDSGRLLPYTVLQADLLRIPRFPLASLALKFFGDEDLAFLLVDVNDNLLDDKTLAVGTVVLIPLDWQQLLAASRPSLPSGRLRPRGPRVP